MKPCTACGRRNPPEHRFCEHCGAPLEPVPAAAAPAPAGPEAATLAPGEASPLHRLPTWLAVGIVVGALIAFGIVGTVLAGQFGSAPGGNGSPIPSGSGAVRTVTTTHVSLEAPVEWEAQAHEPGRIELGRNDIPALVVVQAGVLSEPTTPDALATIARSGAEQLTDGEVCADDPTPLPGLELPARLVAVCYTQTLGTTPTAATQASIVALSPDGRVIYEIQMTAPSDRMPELAGIVERTIFGTIEWKITAAPAGGTDPGTGSAPTPSPSSGPSGSFCEPLGETWSSSAIVGRGVEVAELRAPNSTYVLFAGGTAVLLTALGPADGFGSFEEADGLARQSLVQFDARRLRWIVVEHSGRFFVYEARMYEAGTLDTEGLRPTFIPNPIPAPCRLHPDDGTVVAWRAQVFESTGSAGDWVGAVWRQEGAAMCGQGEIPRIFPGIPPC